MNIKTLKESLSFYFQAQVTPFLWGHAGIGKSSVVKQFAKEKGWYFFPLYLGTQSDMGDLLGLANFVKNEDGTESTTFATPKWLRDAIVHCEQNPNSGAIIFLDELNRGRRDILNGMFSLALDKVFHQVKLPRNCHVIAAGNPPTDEYSVNDIDDSALMSRFAHIKLEPTFEEWVEYARGNEFDNTIVGFVQDQPSMLEQDKTDFALPIKVDRRSYERLDRLVFKTQCPEHLIQELMVSIIGLERTIAYQQYLKHSDKPLHARDVLNRTTHAETSIKKWNTPGDVTASLINISKDNLKEELDKRAKNKTNLTETEKENLFWFLNNIPLDAMYALINDVIKSENKVFIDFVREKQYGDALAELVKTIHSEKQSQVSKEEVKE